MDNQKKSKLKIGNAGYEEITRVVSSSNFLRRN